MRTQLLNSHRLDSIFSVAWLRKDKFVAAHSDHLVWYTINGLYIKEVRRYVHGGRSFPLFSICEHSQAVIQLERSPWNYSLHLVGEDGFIGQPITIPPYHIYQVTTDPSVSLLAVFGVASVSDKPKFIEPVESCLIELASGRLQWLPYSAVAILNRDLYFVKDRNVYVRKLAFRPFARAVDDIFFSDEPFSQISSDQVLHIVPGDDCVWLATERGLFSANTMDVTLVYKWHRAIRVAMCADIVFASTIGPELCIYDTRNRIASCITSSSEQQILGFDVVCLSHEGGISEGLLLIVSEGGILDYYSWSSSR